MFDVSYKKWLLKKREELGSVDAIAENIPSPIQAFLDDRLKPLTKQMDDRNVEYELLFDSSLYPNRKPKILLQTCGHISGATYYYKPSLVSDETWPPRSPGGKKPLFSLHSQMRANPEQFIGLCLHPIYGGHFAFRCVFLFPKIHLPNFTAPQPISILKSKEEIRKALERFNYNYWDSGFRDFGSPLKRYSPIQMEYFGMLPSDRWSLIKRWCDMP
ncbi:hypothetical protein OESDEN_11119 [Oesophagostomum dentatum]|uniref:Cyanocobalamin reductase (cyanide-eliminating) n=1 Tax=Oesophagostomum dentatum TaxID=61180 RepID=A0A0B1SVU0_OESDE|nr:hypothetical protein OESDEN_11119 [Oesophagostomum dentatum]